jgi:hypothetical protein
VPLRRRKLSPAVLMREAIRGHQRPSAVIRGNQRKLSPAVLMREAIRGHQRPSAVIRGNQRSSEAIKALALRSPD